MAETNEQLDEMIYEAGETATEIIAACFNSLGIAESYDYGMCSKTERKLIDDIKEMALRLTHQSLKSIYEANIEAD